VSPITITGGADLQVEAKHRHHAELPNPVPGEHMWTIVGMWRLANPAAERFVLDLENLLTIEGPGCFVCEQPYTAGLAAARCPGEPRG
jgi:hypothetical protein